MPHPRGAMWKKGNKAQRCMFTNVTYQEKSLGSWADMQREIEIREEMGCKRPEGDQ